MAVEADAKCIFNINSNHEFSAKKKTYCESCCPGVKLVGQCNAIIVSWNLGILQIHLSNFQHFLTYISFTPKE